MTGKWKYEQWRHFSVERLFQILSWTDLHESEATGWIVTSVTGSAPLMHAG